MRVPGMTLEICCNNSGLVFFFARGLLCCAFAADGEPLLSHRKKGLDLWSTIRPLESRGFISMAAQHWHLLSAFSYFFQYSHYWNLIITQCQTLPFCLKQTYFSIFFPVKSGTLFNSILVFKVVFSSDPSTACCPSDFISFLLCHAIFCHSVPVLPGTSAVILTSQSASQIRIHPFTYRRLGLPRTSLLGERTAQTQWRGHVRSHLGFSIFFHECWLSHSCPHLLDPLNGGLKLVFFPQKAVATCTYSKTRWSRFDNQNNFLSRKQLALE